MNKNKIIILLVTVLLANMLLASEATAKKCSGLKIEAGYKYPKKYKLTFIFDNEPEGVVDPVSNYVMKKFYCQFVKCYATVEKPFSSPPLSIDTEVTQTGSNISFSVPDIFRAPSGDIQIITFLCNAKFESFCLGCCPFTGTCTSTFSVAGVSGVFNANATVIGKPIR